MACLGLRNTLCSAAHATMQAWQKNLQPLRLIWMAAPMTRELARPHLGLARSRAPILRRCAWRRNIGQGWPLMRCQPPRGRGKSLAWGAGNRIGGKPHTAPRNGKEKGHNPRSPIRGIARGRIPIRCRPFRLGSKPPRPSRRPPNPRARGRVRPAKPPPLPEPK